MLVSRHLRSAKDNFIKEETPICLVLMFVSVSFCYNSGNPFQYERSGWLPVNFREVASRSLSSWVNYSCWTEWSEFPVKLLKPIMNVSLISYSTELSAVTFHQPGVKNTVRRDLPAGCLYHNTWPNMQLLIHLILNANIIIVYYQMMLSLLLIKIFLQFISKLAFLWLTGLNPWRTWQWQLEYFIWFF